MANFVGGAQLADPATAVVATAFASAIWDTDAEALLAPLIAVAVATLAEAAITAAGFAGAVWETDADVSLADVRGHARSAVPTAAVRTTGAIDTVRNAVAQTIR